ncbi:MAG TPA: GNAT family N-acetyltransferase [Burkholderiaceae bacterium]
MSLSLSWRWQRFESLGVDGVYDMLALRARVFILEQGPYLDPDGADRHAWHLLGRDDAGVLLAYLRVLDPGVKFSEPSIGRVVVDASLRGQGVGHELVRAGIERCSALWPLQATRISAQAHLQRFYGQHGFQTMSDEYLDDGIPHVDMRRSAT